MDTESNRKKIGEVLIDHVTKTGAADARDVDDIYKQLVADGVEFDIDWASLVPHLDDLGLKNIEEADRFVKANAQRFSTNPTLLNKVNEVLAFCQLHQLHEVKQEVDPDVADFEAAFEESERMLNEWKPSDVRQTYSANGGGRHELFNRKITALRKFRDNVAHDLRTNRLSETRGMSGKRKGNVLLRVVQQRGEAIFTDSPFLGA